MELSRRGLFSVLAVAPVAVPMIAAGEKRQQIEIAAGEVGQIITVVNSSAHPKVIIIRDRPGRE